MKQHRGILQTKLHFAVTNPFVVIFVCEADLCFAPQTIRALFVRYSYS